MTREHPFNDEPRFWLLDWDAADHLRDCERSMNNGQLIPVVDEEAGGIIAYALGEENAQQILAALRDHYEVY